MLELSPTLDLIIYQEMMTHPALFSHTNPQKIAIIGDLSSNIVNEALKHTTLTTIWHVTDKTETQHTHPLIQRHTHGLPSWMSAMEQDYFDIIIVEKESLLTEHSQYYSLLHSDGILVQISESPYHTLSLKKTHQALRSTGFSDTQTLSFSQPTYPTGWRTALLAKKNGSFKKIREKDIFNKLFATHYYNFDVHKAALVVPEFIRVELTM